MIVFPCSCGSNRPRGGGPGLYFAAVDLRDLAALLGPRFGEYVEALGRMVNLDCGTFCPEGVNRIADLCEERFLAAGWDVERRSHRPGPGEERLGDVVIGRLRGQAPVKLLLIGHMDTVFPEGTAKERPFRVEGDKALGPGVADMKAGLLGGFFALEALLRADAQIPDITFVCNPDEEIGSPFSGPFIRRLAAEAHVSLVLEAARQGGELVSARKGVLDIRIEIGGRAAHAGVEPRRGRSAIVEAANKVLALDALNGRWPGVTVNTGVILGGTRPNVVPERCVLEVDLRSPEDETFTAAQAEVRRIARTSSVEGTTGSVEIGPGFPPMEKTEGTARLVRLAQEVALQLGFEVRDTATGGASDANHIAGMGVPVLDGLGPIGGADHAPGEWLDLTSVVPRMALLAGLIASPTHPA